MSRLRTSATSREKVSSLAAHVTHYSATVRMVPRHPHSGEQGHQSYKMRWILTGRHCASDTAVRATALYSTSHQTIRHAVQSQYAHTSQSSCPSLSSCSCLLAAVWGGLHAVLVSEITQAAQHGRVCIAHECHIAEPFAEWMLLEGQVLIVRALVTC